MLFKQRFHAGIRAGSITLSFRAWRSARVRVGSTIRLATGGAIEIRAVEEVALSSISAAQAERSGFASRDELLETLRASSVKRLNARSQVFRVGFRFNDTADPREALRSDTSAAALDEVAGRLERMDRLSRRGAWTRDVLELIESHPQQSAALLAPMLGRERLPFKADVRKLKALGLTVSHDVGYTLAPRGRALLARLRRD